MGGGSSTRRVTFEADENENITVVKGVRVRAGTPWAFPLGTQGGLVRPGCLELGPGPFSPFSSSSAPAAPSSHDRSPLFPSPLPQGLTPLYRSDLSVGFFMAPVGAEVFGLGLEASVVQESPPG